MNAVPSQPTPVAPGRYRCDVLVVGAGIAGLQAAQLLGDDLEVVVVDKGTPGESGSSPWAQGGLAAAMGLDDSPGMHVADTLAASDGLCDLAAVQVLADESPDRVRDLLDLGAEFDLEDGSTGRLHLAREGGQAVARSVHLADATGAEIVRVLRLAAAPLVSRLPGSVIELSGPVGGRVNGAWVLAPDGALCHVAARTVLLATGGCGGLYASSTNQPHATGDGIALAYQAGAAIRDIEFVQFHPTALAAPDGSRFLLTEALRGAGATLHAENGARFMLRLHEAAELAPRHVVATALIEEVGGTAWLDATGLGRERLEQEFPTAVAGAARHGFDLVNQRVPVTPAAHYLVGGVRTDLHGRTSRPGLLAAGEVASTGVHGANRMAGNSLAEALVFGRRAALTAAQELGALAEQPGSEPTFLLDVGGVEAEQLRSRLRAAMWAGAGPVRDRARLTRLLSELEALHALIPGPAADAALLELHHGLTTAQLVTTSALLRTESRGGHRRLDAASRDPSWEDVHIERSLGEAG